MKWKRNKRRRRRRKRRRRSHALSTAAGEMGREAGKSSAIVSWIPTWGEDVYCLPIVSRSRRWPSLTKFIPIPYPNLSPPPYSPPHPYPLHLTHSNASLLLLLYVSSSRLGCCSSSVFSPIHPLHHAHWFFSLQPTLSTYKTTITTTTCNLFLLLLLAVITTSTITILRF